MQCSSCDKKCIVNKLNNLCETCERARDDAYDIQQYCQDLADEELADEE